MHFFEEEINYNRGFDWYIDSYFKDVKNETAIGDITPNYMPAKGVPERIFNNLGPDVKLIFVLRNPTDRAFSHYNMKNKNGKENRKFKTIVNNWETLETDSVAIASHYIKRGFYDEQIAGFLKYFDKKNCLFLIFEKDIARNMQQTISRVQHFLAIPEEKLISNIKENSSGEIRSNKIDTILNTKNPINTIAKILIPNKRIRNNIKQFLTKANKWNVSYKDFEKVKRDLIKEVYYDSIKKTEILINTDLSDWYNKIKAN